MLENIKTVFWAFLFMKEYDISPIIKIIIATKDARELIISISNIVITNIIYKIRFSHFFKGKFFCLLLC